ncbi:hypothetical protein ACOI1H_17715 [Loktanella sp. DJP18]|uniref:hypothetical protein n=1 Tax=Loktanella sp. DJP18 TaxID=3409788 RepID=UPI003BB52323
MGRFTVSQYGLEISDPNGRVRLKLELGDMDSSRKYIITDPDRYSSGNPVSGPTMGIPTYYIDSNPHEPFSDDWLMCGFDSMAVEYGKPQKFLTPLRSVVGIIILFISLWFFIRR